MRLFEGLHLLTMSCCYRVDPKYSLFAVCWRNACGQRLLFGVLAADHRSRLEIFHRVGMQWRSESAFPLGKCAKHLQSRTSRDGGIEKKDIGASGSNESKHQRSQDRAKLQCKPQPVWSRLRAFADAWIGAPKVGLQRLPALRRRPSTGSCQS
jgi:hypothetical protein